MTFGPPELAQLMQETQATIAVVMLSSVGAGIVLGSIIACCNIIRAKRQRERATGQQVAGALAAEVSNFHSSQADITDDRGGRSRRVWTNSSRCKVGPAPRPSVFPVTLFAVTIVLAVGGGALYWHHTSSAPPAARALRPPSAPPEKGSEFERVYKPTRHSTLALERGTSAAGSKSTCSVES